MARVPPSDAPDPSELAQERFRDFVDAVGRDRGEAAGWKQRLARELGISPGHLSRVLSGKRRVSDDVLQRAAAVFSFDPRLFTSERNPFSDWRPAPPRGVSVGILAEIEGQVRAYSEREWLIRAAREVVARYSRGEPVSADDVDELAMGVLRLRVFRLAESMAEAPEEQRRAQAVRLAVELLDTLAPVYDVDGWPVIKRGDG